MGDRANVCVKDGRQSVYLYTHWSGSELPEVVRVSLAKHWRWEDAAYLTRIVFDGMTAGEHGKETGFGIWSSLIDTDHPIIILDVVRQRVIFRAMNYTDWRMAGTIASYSFKEYCQLPYASWPEEK